MSACLLLTGNIPGERPQARGGGGRPPQSVRDMRLDVLRLSVRRKDSPASFDMTLQRPRRAQEPSCVCLSARAHFSL